MRKLCYLMLLLAWQAHAETYKWKDKDGQVQYGSNPPLGTKTEPVSTIGAGNVKLEKNIIRLDDVDALPYLTKNPEQGRKAYMEYLAAAPAKLFVACANGKYMTVRKPASSYDALRKLLPNVQGYDAGLCHPYAFNDEVVWNRKK